MQSIAGSPLITFLGARGGLGTSTLLSAVAVAASNHHRVALIDGAPRNGHELLLGMDEHAGPYWQESLSAPFAAERSMVDDDRLTVLAWKDLSAPEEAVVDATISGFQRTHDLLMADAGTVSSPLELSLLERASALVFLVPGELRPLTYAAHVATLLSDIAPTHLVVCEPSPTGVHADHIADLLNLPLAAVMNRESRLPLRGEHAQLPTRSLATTAKTLLKALGL